jgi:hypothetical protein
MSRLRLLLVLPVLACAPAQPAGDPPTSSEPSPASTGQRIRISSVDMPPDMVFYEMVSGPDGGSVSHFRASLDRIWAALPLAFEALQLQGQVLNASEYRYGQNERSVRMRLGGGSVSRYFDCGMRGGVPNADNYSVTYTVTSQLHTGAEGTTQLRTRVTANARATGTGDQRIRCSSTGRMEREIHDFIARRLPPGG